MITRLSISNFRSIGANVEIRPGRLNFLVGANGSGKSNVLRALTFVREAVRMGLPGAITINNGIESVRRHSSGHPRNVRIEIDASLDKRNASRLADFLKKYAQKGQYIVISHNDEIITNAQTLFGISMHEGISKLTALKV